MPLRRGAPIFHLSTSNKCSLLAQSFFINKYVVNIKNVKDVFNIYDYNMFSLYNICSSNRFDDSDHRPFKQYGHSGKTDVSSSFKDRRFKRLYVTLQCHIGSGLVIV